MEDKDLRLYLDRIGLKDYAIENLTPTQETLRLIHQGHTYHIPFENLDPVRSVPVSLEPSELIQQLIHNKRGGYCLQQNALFTRALRKMGFQVKPLAARVLWGVDRTNLRTLCHRTSLVTLNDGSRWVADVGFGGYTPLLGPIPFQIDAEYTIFADKYKIEKDEDESLSYILQWFDQENDKWEDMYCFQDVEYLDVDYDMMNYYVYSHPESLFVNNVICGISCPEGTTVLFNNTLSIRKNHKMVKYKVETEEDLRRILKEELRFSNLGEDLVHQIFNRIQQLQSNKKDSEDGH